MRTWIKVRPSSRNRRNGTSESIGLRSSDQPVLVRNCDPVTAQIGVCTPGKADRERETIIINYGNYYVEGLIVDMIYKITINLQLFSNYINETG